MNRQNNVKYTYNLIGGYMNFGPILGGATGGLSFVRILGSISKSLGIVREIAPIYRDMKPLFAKAPLLFEKINNIRNMTASFKEIPRSLEYSTPINNMPNMPIQNGSGPVFFQ